MSYGDVMKMPTYERRLFINLFKKDMELRQEHMENQKNNSSSGKGNKKTRITGDAVKKYSGMS
jgi:hypothetical protein